MSTETDVNHIAKGISKQIAKGVDPSSELTEAETIARAVVLMAKHPDVYVVYQAGGVTVRLLTEPAEETS